MVKTLKLLAYFAFFILALIYFSPKESIYYFGEKGVEKYKVVLSGEKITDSGFYLDLNDVTVSYDSIQSAKVEDINVKMFLLYNSISAKNIKLSNIAVSFIPLHVQSLDVSYTIFNPLVIGLNANGEFGEAKGEINILDRNITMVITPSKVMETKHQDTLANLKKNANGSYSYDKSF